MFDKNRGLVWYRIIQGLSIFWIITNFAMAGIGPVIPELSIADVSRLFPLYACYYRVVRLATMGLAITLFVKMKSYDPNMLIVWEIMACIGFANVIIEPVLLSTAYNVKITSDILAEYSGQAIVLIIWFLPTFIYLRKRCFSYKYSKLENKIGSSPAISIDSPPQTLEENDIEQNASHALPTISFCRFCGNELRDSSTYCDNCGKKVR